MMRKKTKAQVSIEFTFGMIMVLIMVYGVVHIFRWVATDFVERQRSHDATIKQNGISKKQYSSPAQSPVVRQLEPVFHSPVDMNAIWEDAL